MKPSLRIASDRHRIRQKKKKSILDIYYIRRSSNQKRKFYEHFKFWVKFFFCMRINFFCLFLPCSKCLRSYHLNLFSWRTICYFWNFISVNIFIQEINIWTLRTAKQKTEKTNFIHILPQAFFSHIDITCGLNI